MDIIDFLRRFLHLAALSLTVLAGCASIPREYNPSAVQALAPSGKLRVGLYPGTPTSILGDPASGRAKGVGFELGQELARRSGLGFEPVVFSKNAEVLASAKAGAVDMVFTNATPARRNDLDFSPTVLQVELGFLVPAASTTRTPEQIDRAGVRVGVSEGSTSEATLSRELKSASVVRTPSLKAAAEMLTAGQLDAFATNKATLFEMAGEVPGSRVLDGRWGLESFAIGIPKRRDAALPLVSRFADDAKADGTVGRAVERAGLRGTVLPR